MHFSQKIFLNQKNFKNQNLLELKTNRRRAVGKGIALVHGCVRSVDHSSHRRAVSVSGGSSLVSDRGGASFSEERDHLCDSQRHLCSLPNDA